MIWGSFAIGCGCGLLAGAVIVAALALYLFGPILEGLTDAMGRR